MDIKLGYINISVESQKLPNNVTPVIFIHGFTQSSTEWTFILNKLPKSVFPILVDFIGHGKSDSPENVNKYSAEAICSYSNSIYEYFKIDKAILVGYSMGGRAALSFATNFPHKVAGLVLESTSPGISEQKNRKERILADSKIINIIKEKGINKFVKFWMELPLFNSLKSLPEKDFIQIKESKLINNSIGLVNTLLGFGTGQMPSLWNDLQKIENVLLITGDLDKKFCSINKLMKNRLISCEHKIIKKCGHNIHLEKPEDFTILVNSFLEKIMSEK